MIRNEGYIFEKTKSFNIMKHFDYTDETPIAMLTVGQLRGILDSTSQKQEELLAKITDLFSLVKAEQPAPLMTRNEAANYLSIDLSTLYNWTKKGKLPAYGIGNRVYYKSEDIEMRLIQING